MTSNYVKFPFVPVPGHTRDSGWKAIVARLNQAIAARGQRRTIIADVRARGGLAWFACVNAAGNLQWKPNPRCRWPQLIRKRPRRYDDFAIEPGVPIYRSFSIDPTRFQFVPRPARARSTWPDFVP